MEPLTRLVPTAFVVLLLGPGCMGLVDGTEGPRGNAGGGPGDAENRVPSSLTRCDDLGTIDVAPATMRRLSRVELDHTLHDLGLVDPDVSYAPNLAGDLSVGNRDRGFAVGGPVDDTLALDLVNVALDVARKATSNLPELTGCDPEGSADEGDCARDFIGNLGPRLFRRPLTDDEATTLFALYASTRTAFDHRTGIETVLASMLTAPDFIYLYESEPEGAEDGEVIPLEGYAVASRLSYFLWDSTPDEALLLAAADGALTTEEEIAAQAERMLADPRAKRAVQSFFEQWSLSRQLGELAKDDPLFNDAMRSSLQVSMEATFDDAFFGEEGTLEHLFGSAEAFVSDAIAPLFGLKPGMGEAPVAVTADSTPRRGLLTHPGFLAVSSKADRSDPIHRGLFVREMALCVDLPDPPATDAEGNPVILDVPPAEPGLSDRDLFAAHTERPECGNCHRLVDPIGFGFENYDELGRYRTKNKFGDAIDASGEVFDGGDLSGPFTGVVELAEKVSTSESVADCMGIQWFRFALDRREEPEHDACSNASTLKSFLDGKRTFKDLVLGVVRSAGFRHRRVGGVTP